MKSADLKQLEQTMYGQVLDVDHFPTAVYASSDVRVEKPANGPLLARVNGALSFHGVTQNQPIEARIVEMGSTLRISGAVWNSTVRFWHQTGVFRRGRAAIEGRG